MENPTQNLTIHDLARGGAGVARQPDGRVVFVPYTMPGDKVNVRLTSTQKNYAQGALESISAPSPDRTTPRCPVFTKCGGCQWQHVPYELQWKTKFEGVKSALKRVSVSIPDVIDSFPAKNPWNYRNRVQLKGHNGSLGFYEQNTRKLIPIEQCAIARDEINDHLPVLKDDERAHAKQFNVEIEIRENSIRTYWNQPHAAGGFRQVNDDQNEVMKRWVEEKVLEATSEPFELLDLFGGDGNLSRALHQHALHVHCVDLSVPDFSSSKCTYHRANVLSWLLRYTERAPSDTQRIAIIDPPRSGLDQSVTEIATCLRKLNTQKIIVIGCDPDSFSKDMSRWKKQGWSLTHMGVIDLFPQTPHVETLGVLTRA